MILNDDITALDVKNAFQGIAISQKTPVKYYEKHNDNFFLRVGIDRSKVTYNNITKIYINSIVYFKMFSIFACSLTMNAEIKMNRSHERKKRTTGRSQE